MGISLEQALKRYEITGVHALPLFAPSGAFPRPLTPHRIAGKCCQSGVGRFLRVLGGASLSPIRRTRKTKIPLKFGEFFALIWAENSS